MFHIINLILWQNENTHCYVLRVIIRSVVNFAAVGNLRKIEKIRRRRKGKGKGEEEK